MTWYFNDNTLKVYLAKRDIYPSDFSNAPSVVVSNADYVLIDSSILNNSIAVFPDSIQTEGQVVAVKLPGSIGTASTAKGVDSRGLIINKVDIRDASTSNPVLDIGTGKQIYGFFHCDATTNDNDLIGVSGSENLQISFVIFNDDGTISNVNVNTTIEFTYNTIYSKRETPDLAFYGSNVSADIVSFETDTVVNAELQSGIEGEILYVNETRTFYRYIVSGSAYTRDGVYVLNTLTGGNTRWMSVAGYFAINNTNYNMFEPTGYSRLLANTTGQLSFDEPARTVTMEPLLGESYFSLMLSGQEYFFTTPQSIIISDVQGRHFVYFDEDRQLKELVNPSNYEIGNVIYQKGYTAFVYWNATTKKGRAYNERHGNKMDGETHANLHLTRGTQFISGCAPGLVGIIDGTGDLDSDLQISIGGGLAADEDLPIIITNNDPQVLDPIAYIPVFYLTDMGIWNWDTATTFPVKSFGVGSRLAYNNFNGVTWEQLEVGNNDFLLTHIFGTNDIIEPIIAIQGQGTYNTLGQARDGATEEINNLIFVNLPSQEFFPIATFIVHTSDAYSNTMKARFRSTDDGDDFIEWRFSGLSPATSTSYHNNLSGRADLNSHPSSAISHTTIDSVVSDVEAGLHITEYERSERLEPNGFVDRITTAIDWDNTTRTLTLTPTGIDYPLWIQGKRYVIDSIKQVIASTNNGIHFLYFRNTDLELFDDEFPPTDLLLSGVGYVLLEYWNNTQGIAIHVGDERHGIVMDWADHDYKHNVFGARYVSGLSLDNFTIGDGSIDLHAQLNCSDGIIKDEDLEHSIVNNSPQQLDPILQAPVFYRVGPDLWYRTEADNFPFIQSGKQGYVAGSITTIYTGANARPAYNEFTGGNWQLTELGRDEFVLLHFFATNDIYYPVIVIIGITKYTKEKDAQDAAYSEIQSLSGLPFVEFTPIGSVILEANDTFTNSVNARFVETDVSGVYYIDFRDTRTFRETAATFPTLRSNNYTPTLTNVTNVTASTIYLIYYQGIGTTIRVWGEISIQTTAIGTTQFRLTLPITSTFGNTYELSGNGSEQTGSFSVSVRADTTNHEALFEFIALAASTYSLHFDFGYIVQ